MRSNKSGGAADSVSSYILLIVKGASIIFFLPLPLFFFNFIVPHSPPRLFGVRGGVCVFEARCCCGRASPS